MFIRRLQAFTLLPMAVSEIPRKISLGFVNARVMFPFTVKEQVPPVVLTPVCPKKMPPLIVRAMKLAL